MSDSSDEEVYFPYEFNGDGRKREAKRHKSNTVVTAEEIAVD